MEAKYLLKLMLNDMRIGVKQSLIEEAIGDTDSNLVDMPNAPSQPHTLKHVYEISEINDSYDQDMTTSEAWKRRRENASTDPGSRDPMGSFRRTVSWSGTLEEFETVDTDSLDDESHLETAEEALPLLTLSNNTFVSFKLRQFSNLPRNLVHFRAHRDSVELYQERKKHRQLKNTGFVRSRRTTQLRMARPRQASEVLVDPVPVEDTEKK